MGDQYLTGALGRDLAARSVSAEDVAAWVDGLGWQPHPTVGASLRAWRIPGANEHSVRGVVSLGMSDDDGWFHVFAAQLIDAVCESRELSVTEALNELAQIASLRAQGA